MDIAVSAVTIILSFAATVIATFKIIVPALTGALAQRTEHQHQQELELLRESLSSRREERANLRELLKDITAIQSSQHSGTFEKRLSAMLMLWEKTQESKQFFQHAFRIYDYHKESDIVNIPVAGSNFAHLIPGHTMSDLNARSVELRAEVEKVRPLLGEDLWSMFKVYQGLGFGILIKLTRAVDSDDRIPAWDKFLSGTDAGLRSLASSIVPAETLGEIEKLEYGFPMRLLEQIEVGISERVHKFVLGVESAEVTLGQQKILQSRLLEEGPWAAFQTQSGRGGDSLPAKTE